MERQAKIKSVIAIIITFSLSAGLMPMPQLMRIALVIMAIVLIIFLVSRPEPEVENG